MMDRMIDEVPVFEVDGSFFDPAAAKHVSRLAHPVLLTVTLLPASSTGSPPRPPIGRLGPRHRAEADGAVGVGHDHARAGARVAQELSAGAENYQRDEAHLAHCASVDHAGAAAAEQPRVDGAQPQGGSHAGGGADDAGDLAGHADFGRGAGRERGPVRARSEELWRATEKLDGPERDRARILDDGSFDRAGLAEY
ncbi:hypothetical protein EW146_g9604 [Bondarzewia mesenterica]|uniref:Uncharacterized protein n=1 Tax=Bondarzewia mesenterica TaxID=1095465 RepID=A0A4S4L534_9AGAM|nr:hypothetical protein EW146_g9604 [Bondarzewia mesenterica]